MPAITKPIIQIPSSKILLNPAVVLLYWMTLHKEAGVLYTIEKNLKVRTKPALNL